MKKLEQTWRWYGPNDPVSLQDIRQAGATGIVTALHHVPIGEVWEVDEILKRKAEVEKGGLNWSVIESLPVHEDVKTQTGDFQKYTENHKISLKNIGKCGLDTLCYNFMPALDWTRTHLNAPFKDGSTALSYDQITFAAFDLFILERKNARNDYNDATLKEAEECFQQLSTSEKEELVKTIVAGLPGTDQHFGLNEFRNAIEKYEGIDADVYREHVRYFLSEIIAVAEENNIKMAIHPDDPPYNILGLPRIISSAEDIRKFLSLNDSNNNGLTLCTGSLGARMENDLPAMVSEFGDRIHFVHLRNVSNFGSHSFFEDNHLEGNVNMFEVMKALVELSETKDGSRPIPFRPDHGHRMLDDLGKKVNAGYSAIGRLRGLAELRGLELGIRKSMAI
ncbi:MAG: mannonate dehydratase [Cyclobacteriaceae bacterium]